MAIRWRTPRRVAIIVIFFWMIGLFYYQLKQVSQPPWDDQPGSAAPGSKPASPPKPPLPSLPPAPAVAPPAQGPPPPPQPQPPPPPLPVSDPPPSPPTGIGNGKFRWTDLELHYPINSASMRPVPTPSAERIRAIPKIQHKFAQESDEAKALRLERLALVKANFTHAWHGYKEHAWLSDEVRPIKGTAVHKFGGWAATLVDALDSLWIMDLRDEFENAVAAIDEIDFTTTTLDQVNLFETTIRYLGGFLSAYDISGGKYPSLLRKAVELGDMLYVAFDTPNHMPITRWKFNEARMGELQEAPKTALVSELGSLSLEFTRLSQLSGDNKYFDAVQRVMDVFHSQQDKTHIPGLWPVVVNSFEADFTAASGFTIGGMADSLYEYLPKEYLLLGGAVPEYGEMYLKSLSAMEQSIFFRARTNHSAPMLFPGDSSRKDSQSLSQLQIEPKVQHLGCFAGGMVALGSRLFSRPDDMTMARELVEGCLWGYENAPNGIMPEIMRLARCPDAHVACDWDEKAWLGGVAAQQKRAKTDPEEPLDATDLVRLRRLRPGITKYDDARYILRPEAIESVFILYRLTGDATLLERAWRMFEAIVSLTTTDIAHSALNDCTLPDPRTSLADSMESFWLAETLKYFYLLYDSPDKVSLDEYVLNTEAHPLRRPAL